jgi:hypothetical protein
MRADREMYARFLVLMIISALLVAAIYSSTSSDVLAIKAHTPTLCEKTTTDGITTENCCHFDTDSKTEKITEYCTDCKTASGGEDLGCTHTQTDVGLTINDGKLGIKTIGPKVSTDKLSDDNKVQVPKHFDLKNDKLLTKDSEIATEENQVTTNEENSKTPPPIKENSK